MNSNFLNLNLYFEHFEYFWLESVLEHELVLQHLLLTQYFFTRLNLHEVEQEDLLEAKTV